MFVPCPHCGFLVALIVSRPDAAQRCPRCGQPLQLTDGGEDDDAAAASATAAVEAAQDSDAEPVDEAPVIDPAGKPADVEGTADAGSDVETEAEAGTLAGNATKEDTAAAAPRPRTRRAARGHRASAAPSFARRSVSMLESGPRWPAIIAFVALLAVLVLQLLLAQRHALAADAGWRPRMTALCDVVGCQLRPWREPAAFTMLARDVRPATGAAEVLQVEASFRNDAQWPQPWPRLLLRLNDRHGRTVGERLFTPAEYLGQRASTPNLLAPGQSASVRFTVREPAAEIVAFDFDFR